MLKYRKDNQEHLRIMAREYMRKKRAANPALREKDRESAKHWNTLHPERARENAKRWRLKNLARARELHKNWNKKNPIKCLLIGAKTRAKTRNILFALTVDDILIPSTCPILGIPLYFSNGRWTDNSPTLDRLHNDKGYTPENVVVISHRANRLKSNASLQELVKFGRFAARHLRMRL
jgi:hypothetical protein